MREWIDRYARELGLPALTDDEVDALLELAGVAAHDSARPSAPVSCWLAARAGLTPSDALAKARDMAERL
jgi:hypothetical protein